ncbi:hydrolase [Desulfoluna limicola]|uniref:Hydrolase n=1 Tax=Desulfoluna limicola TaxID=2810562 RepID=A0ABN6F5F2_9BACT|nr:alpha/beta hydrolase [Desulfoluna limicola]BCS97196.1 hydrolase [Desulfoluna limicola]
MSQRDKKWRHIVRGQFTRHEGLAPQTLEAVLMGDLTADTKHCDISGHHIHWLEAGDGPPLVLVHGWTCSGFFWKPIIPRLKGTFRVLAPDLPGHGLSSKGEASYLPEAQAHRLLEWLTTIGVDRFVLVGHSMGGEVAARMALSAPDRVQKLVLAGAIGLEEAWERLPWYGRLSLTPAARKVSNWFFTERAMARTNRLFMTGPGRPPYLECARDVVLTNTNTPHDLKALTYTTRDGLFQDFLDQRLSELNLPVLCIWGKNDKVVPLEVGKRVARLLPHVRLVQVPGTGHMLPWEEPEVMTSEILEFAKPRSQTP